MKDTSQNEATWRALSRAFCHVQTHLDAALKAQNLPRHDVFEALDALSKGVAPLTAKTLETALDMPQYGVSRLLDRMQKQGFIHHSTHQADKRIKLLQVTAHGGATLEKMAKVRTQALDDYLSRRAKPGQLDRLTDLLTLLDQE